MRRTYIDVRARQFLLRPAQCGFGALDVNLLRPFYCSSQHQAQPLRDRTSRPFPLLIGSLVYRSMIRIELQIGFLQARYHS
jgi:hypothetical protein